MITDEWVIIYSKIDLIRGNNSLFVLLLDFIYYILVLCPLPHKVTFIILDRKQIKIKKGFTERFVI